MSQLDSEPQEIASEPAFEFAELTNPRKSNIDRTPEVSITELIPASVRERVTIAAPESWVTLHDVDREYREDCSTGVTTLLDDSQIHTKNKAHYHRYTQRLETIRAVQYLAQWKYESFDPATDCLTIHHITVFRDGKSFEQAQTRRLRFLQREANLENFVLDGVLTIAVVLDDVRVGDILDVAYTLQRSPRFPTEKYGGIFTVHPAAAIRAYYFSVQFPESHPMQWKGSVEFGVPAVETLDGETKWSWMLEKVRPRELERRVPARHFVCSWIQISSYQSWAEVAAEIHASWNEQLDGPGIIEHARAIAAANTSPSARADKAITFVQDELRYLRNDIDLGGIVPSPPAETICRRFGDCKDKSFLLVHLLRILGIPARPALVNATLDRGIQQLMPMPAAFNHVIVEYSINGQRRWADATITQQGGGALERYIPDFGLALPIGPNVKELEPVPTSPSKDYYHLRESFRLDTTGRPPLLRVAVSASGSEADRFRAAIALDGAEAVSRFREGFYRRLFPQVRRLDALEWRDDRNKNEVLIAESYELPGAMISVPSQNAFFFRFRSYLVQSYLAYPESAKRKLPLELPPRVRLEHFIDLESPGLPRGNSENFIKRSGSFRVSYDTKKLFGRWTTHFTLRIIESEVQHQNFDQFREHVKEIIPKTFVPAALPAGIVASRGKRRGLGQIVSDASKDPSPTAEPPPLPAEPAPPLGSLSDEPPVPTPSSARFGPRRSHDSDDTSDHSFVTEEPAPDISEEPTDTTMEARQSQRRRRRRKKNYSIVLLWIIPSAAILAFFIWYLLQRLHH